MSQVVASQSQLKVESGQVAYLRNLGIQCYGIGPAIDREDAALGFGAHSDQERILISELNRFVRFNWDIVLDIAAQK